MNCLGRKQRAENPSWSICHWAFWFIAMRHVLAVVVLVAATGKYLLYFAALGFIWFTADSSGSLTR